MSEPKMYQCDQPGCMDECTVDAVVLRKLAGKRYPVTQPVLCEEHAPEGDAWVMRFEITPRES